MKRYFMLCLTLLGIVSTPFLEANAQLDSTSTAEQEFVNKAISTNRFEIAIASQAMERSSNAEVKQFAQALLKEHTKTLEELEQAATAKKLELPDAMEENHASILKSIGALSGDDFNNAFKEVVVKSHEDGIALFELAAGDAGLIDPELKAWAGDKIPMLNAHLEKAKALKVMAVAAR